MKAFLITIQSTLFLFALLMCNVTFCDYTLMAQVQVVGYIVMAGCTYWFRETIKNPPPPFISAWPTFISDCPTFISA